MLKVLREPARRISQRSREKKLAFLRQVIEPGASVLVVGVSGVAGLGTQSLIERGLLDHCDVTGLTYEPMAAADFPGRFVRGDGRRLPFRDGAFDYVVSNAVIEHLGGLDGAARLLAESDRVARRGWVHTTPNRRFPVGLHTGVPLAHWLPSPRREAAFARLGIPFPPEHYWLLSPPVLRRLAPGARVTTLSRIRPAMTLLVVSGAFAEPATTVLPAAEAVPA